MHSAITCNVVQSGRIVGEAVNSVSHSILLASFTLLITLLPSSKFFVAGWLQNLCNMNCLSSPEIDNSFQATKYEWTMD